MKRIAPAIILAFACCLAAFNAAPAFAAGSPTVTTIGSSQNPAPPCSSVTFTATVHGAPWPDSPLGFVQFFDGVATLGAPQAISWDFDPDPIFGTHTIPTNHSSASISVVLSGGSHSITAVYAGTDVPSTGGPLTQTITAATSTTEVVSSADPSVSGQPVVLAAVVSSSCSGSVAGSVQFKATAASSAVPSRWTEAATRRSRLRPCPSEPTRSPPTSRAATRT